MIFISKYKINLKAIRLRDYNSPDELNFTKMDDLLASH